MRTVKKNSLKLSVEQIEGAVVVHAGGMADIATAEKMKTRLEELAERNVPVIILDIGELKFICSVGLGAIIGAHLKCRHHQGEIRLVNPQPAVLDVLETTRLTHLFPIYSNVEDALLAGTPCQSLSTACHLLHHQTSDNLCGIAEAPRLQ